MIATSELFSLAGSTALITGASSGFGQHFARVLHAAGAQVVLAARRQEPLRDLADELGDRASIVALNVTDEASVRAAFTEIAALGPPADILVNNAGIAATEPMPHHSTAAWDQVMTTNLRGAFLVAQEAARRMIEAGRPGSIINIASITGMRAVPGIASYAAAKAGLLHLTRQMAVELARHAIRVNALAPGYFDTPLNRDFFASKAGADMIARIPRRRLGMPGDLTGPLLLLASSASAHMTGAVVTVDGGHSINKL